MKLVSYLATLALAISFAPLGFTQALPSFHDTEVPFITTPDRVSLEMLKLAQVGPQDQLLDLGSGDGRIVILAARQFGARGLGVEIVPDLVLRAQANAKAAGVADRAQFREQDLFKTDLSAATVITLYLLPEVNLQLRPALLALKPGTRLVSHDWDMGDWKPDQTVTVDAPDKTIGREKTSKLHLWVVPAQVAGLWCGSGLLRTMSLAFSQTFQQFQGQLRRGSQTRDFTGHLTGATLHAATGTAKLLTIEHQGDALRIVGAENTLSGLRGTAFQRAKNGRCG